MPDTPTARRLAARAIYTAVALALPLLLAVGFCSAAAAATRSPTITFFFGLKRPEAKAQAAFFAVQRPGSRQYRHFLTVRQISVRYGASSSTRAAFMREISRLGLSVRIDPSGVFARVSGTVRQFDRVFKAQITSLAGNAPNEITFSLKPGASLTLPADLRALVQDVVPTYAHSATPSGHLTAADVDAARAPRRSGTWTGGCEQAKSTGAFSYAQVRHAYGIDRLGDGSGAAVAILNVAEGLLGQDIAANARCFGYPRLRTRTLRSDGQTSDFGQPTFEPEEDLAVIRGMAPRLRSLTFAQVWSSPELWFLGASHVLDAPHLPDSFSISYGECERMIRGKGSTRATRAGADLFDALFVRLGLAGVGTYASSGDSGSTCNGLPYAGIAWPASSPYVTAVGGTRLTLNRANERTNEVVWNDTLWTPASMGGGASGGGFSIASPRPPYQNGLGLPGHARTTPDVSASASNFPGWPVELGGTWAIDGGTSGAAPLIASAMAVLSADQQRRHRPPIGPANGLFYYLARHAPSTIFDVVSGTNSYSPKVRGFRARRGYDLASGLGVPQFAALAAKLPGPGCCR